MKFAFIHAEKAKLPTTPSRARPWACLAAATTPGPSGRRRGERSSDAKLVPVIRACHAQSRATYGSPRIHSDLRALELPDRAQACGPPDASGGPFCAAAASLSRDDGLEAHAAHRTERRRATLPRGWTQSGVGH